MLALQVMYVAAIVGAGLVGGLTLFAPALAAKYVFFGELEIGPIARILGALWLALGLVAVLGLAAPLAFAPVLLVQLIYKAVWVLGVAVPRLIGGKGTPALRFFAALFGAWAIALAFVLPFGTMLAA